MRRSLPILQAYHSEEPAHQPSGTFPLGRAQKLQQGRVRRNPLFDIALPNPLAKRAVELVDRKLAFELLEPINNIQIDNQMTT
jgi:hypothetical protein